jgi:U3 small nucleolar RNA-associated protein 10
MAALLQLLPLYKLLQLMPDLLREMNEKEKELKPQAIQVLSKELRNYASNDTETATAALTLLSDLEGILLETDDNLLKTATLTCVDAIVEKYGRKDVDALINIGRVLAGNAGLAASVPSIQRLSALTLCSAFDVMGEASVPVVLDTVENVLKLVEASFEEEKLNLELHDAGFALISSVISNVGFMVSEEQVDRILILASEATFSDLPSSGADARKDALTCMARKIELNTLVTSLSRTWDKIVESDIDAVLPAIATALAAVEHNAKPTVVRNADTVSEFILKVLDLRRIQFTTRGEDSYSDTDVEQVEQKASELAIKFIYKLNDTTFRPIFETWIEWGVKCHDLDSKKSLARSKLLRQTSLFALLNDFFSMLKSIVTSYAAYILPTITATLQSFAAGIVNKFKLVALLEQDTLEHYAKLLTLFRSITQHDTDSFFTSPRHFSPLSTYLLAQLKLAAVKPFRNLINTHVIPSIVSLAIAVQETPAHHILINHYLVQLRHEDSAAVRLAGIRTQLALTGDEDVGDEWVNNIVTGSASIDVLEDLNFNDENAVVDGNIAPGETGTGATQAKKTVAGGSGETMIYVNESLEDDDEEVEREVRRWVRLVRDKVGEDVFEF